MSSILQCDNNIQRYQKLKANVIDILSYLSSSINSSDDLNSFIKNNYLIDDLPSPITSRIINLKNNMITTYNYLAKTILPTINNAIVSTNNIRNELIAEENANLQNNG